MEIHGPFNLGEDGDDLGDEIRDFLLSGIQQAKLRMEMRAAMSGMITEIMPELFKEAMQEAVDVLMEPGGAPAERLKNGAQFLGLYAMIKGADDHNLHAATHNLFGLSTDAKGLTYLFDRAEEIMEKFRPHAERFLRRAHDAALAAIDNPCTCGDCDGCESKGGE